MEAESGCLADEAETVALDAEDDRLSTGTPPAFSSSELSSDEELEEPEEAGRGVLVACFRAFLSAFLADFSSESEDEESEDEDEDEEEDDEEDEDESESEDEESDESEEEELCFLTFFVL